MKLTNKFVVSQWALYQCLKGNDIPEIRDLIIDPMHAFVYCKEIKNREEVREKINSEESIFKYCGYISSRPEMWERLIKLRLEKK